MGSLQNSTVRSTHVYIKLPADLQSSGCQNEVSCPRSHLIRRQHVLAIPFPNSGGAIAPCMAWHAVQSYGRGTQNCSPKKGTVDTSYWFRKFRKFTWNSTGCLHIDALCSFLHIVVWMFYSTFTVLTGIASNVSVSLLVVIAPASYVHSRRCGSYCVHGEVHCNWREPHGCIDSSPTQLCLWLVTVTQAGPWPWRSVLAHPHLIGSVYTCLCRLGMQVYWLQYLSLLWSRARAAYKVVLIINSCHGSACHASIVIMTYQLNVWLEFIEGPYLGDETSSIFYPVKGIRNSDPVHWLEWACLTVSIG